MCPATQFGLQGSSLGCPSRWLLCASRVIGYNHGGQMRGAMSAEPRQPGPPDVGTPASTIPMGLRILAMVLRALFIGALVAVTARISSPQSEVHFDRIRELPAI